ncbi:hypothetical protein [Octadecabacter arcticus]|uniref:hypothetical protein n=1 Tax=Octadecabacter arcticus TaxID=53946 RepID=UPI000180899E|nr:hypothetical protein [Octadecabacter arcticus]
MTNNTQTPDLTITPKQALVRAGKGLAAEHDAVKAADQAREHEQAASDATRKLVATVKTPQMEAA